MALSADDEAFLDELLDTLQAPSDADDEPLDALQGKDALALELEDERGGEPELFQQLALGGKDSSRGIATGSTRSGSVAQADDAEAQHLLKQLGAGGSTGSGASPRMDPLGELLCSSDSEPWNELLHRFCIQGDESIVEVLLDHLVQSGRDAGALIEALASANLAGASLEEVVAEVSAGSAACYSARSNCSSLCRVSFVEAPRSPLLVAPPGGPAAGAETGDGQARTARTDASARGVAAQRFEEIADPEEARNFMRLFLRDVRQRYLADCCGDLAVRQRTTVLSDVGGAEAALVSARSMGTPSVMTIRDSDSLQDCDDVADLGDTGWM